MGVSNSRASRPVSEKTPIAEEWVIVDKADAVPPTSNLAAHPIAVQLITEMSSANDNTSASTTPLSTPPSAAEKPKNAMQLMMQRKRQQLTQKQEAPPSQSTVRDLHLGRDIAKLASLPSGKFELLFPDQKDLAHFSVVVKPDEGIYAKGRFKFSIEVPEDYNFAPPKVRCLTAVFHPNIDSDGRVCLNILRSDWSPALDLSAVMLGLLYLFYSPNPEDPLDKEAAELLRKNPDEFQRKARRSFGQK